MIARVLVIAGSDNSAGAGIQADIKTISSHNCYCTTAITSLTAQNSFKVESIFVPPSNFLKQQIDTIMNDIGTDIIKIGMVKNKENIEVICNFLEKHKNIIVIIDPLVLSSTNQKLLDDDAIEILKKKLFPKAFLITPNLDEASLLSGISYKNNLSEIGNKLLSFGAKNILIKGGHDNKEIVTDVLINNNYNKEFSHKRILQKNFRGTGCTLSSAIAANLALGNKLDLAIEKAEKYVFNAILNAPDIGKKAQPLSHIFHKKI